MIVIKLNPMIPEVDNAGFILSNVKFSLTLLTLVALGLFCILTVMFFYFLRFKNRIKNEMSEKNEELLSHYQLLKKQNDNITKSIIYARSIQKALLPSQLDLAQHLPDSFILLRPKDIISGDYYWYYNLDSQSDNKETKQSEKFAIAAIDCTGHGIPGSMLSMIGFNLLNEIIMEESEHANVVLEKLHQRFRKVLRQEETKNHDGMEMSLCIVDKRKKIISFAGAVNSIVYFQNEQQYKIRGDRYPIGGIHSDKEKTFTNHIINIDHTTYVYLYTDGFADQFGGREGKKFMSIRFNNLLKEIHKDPMPDQRQVLKETHLNWRNQIKQTDDILIIGFKIDGHQN